MHCGKYLLCLTSFNSHHHIKASLSVQVFQMKEKRRRTLEMPVQVHMSLQEPVQDRLVGILEFKLHSFLIHTKMLEEGINTNG